MGKIRCEGRVVLNILIKELWLGEGGAKWMDERIDESIVRWFGYIERMENDRIA